MMSLEATLIHMKSWAQEEIAAQTVLHEVLQRMEAAVQTGTPDDLTDAGSELEAAVEGNLMRERRRNGLMTSCARLWQVPAATLSLSSIIERAEAEGLQLNELRVMRDELRLRVQAVASRAHTLVVLAGHHRGVLQDLMAILGTASDDEEARQAGILMDAEA